MVARQRKRGAEEALAGCERALEQVRRTPLHLQHQLQASGEEETAEAKAALEKAEEELEAA
jgi:hypothetical protein